MLCGQVGLVEVVVVGGVVGVVEVVMVVVVVGLEVVSIPGDQGRYEGAREWKGT